MKTDAEREDEVTADARPGREWLEEERQRLLHEMESRENIVNELQHALEERETEITDLKHMMTENEVRLAENGQALALAVDRYRELVIAANPGVLAEMISGETVAEVDESLRHALAIVDKVRREVEAETAAGRIPAGAPPRGVFNVAGLSSREKIQYAIGGTQ